MTKRFLLLAIPLLAAAAPQRQGVLSLHVPSPADYPFTARVQAPRPQQPGPVYEPAPLPDPSVLPPLRAESTGTQISPNLFNRSDSFRGAALSKGESTEGDQNRNLRPSPGFTLRMPLQPTGGQTPQ
jgi:hypothetical protein